MSRHYSFCNSISLNCAKSEILIYLPVPELDFMRVDADSEKLVASWNEPREPNGVIQEYYIAVITARTLIFNVTVSIS